MGIFKSSNLITLLSYKAKNWIHILNYLKNLNNIFFQMEYY